MDLENALCLAILISATVMTWKHPFHLEVIFKNHQSLVIDLQTCFMFGDSHLCDNNAIEIYMLLQLLGEFRIKKFPLSQSYELNKDPAASRRKKKWNVPTRVYKILREHDGNV